MTSLKAVLSLEEELEKSIGKIENEIVGLQSEVNQRRIRLEEVCENKHHFQEEAFEVLYGKPAAQVRQEYVDLLTRCSGSGGKGHAVKVPGYDLDKRHPASHIVLFHKHYEVCKPTPLIIEAFATVGQEVWIEPQPHIERWGN